MCEEDVGSLLKPQEVCRRVVKRELPRVYGSWAATKQGMCPVVFDLSPTASLSGSDAGASKGEETQVPGRSDWGKSCCYSCCLHCWWESLLRKGLGLTHAWDADLVTSRPSDCGPSLVTGKTRSLEMWVLSLLLRSWATFIKLQNLSESQMLHP